MRFSLSANGAASVEVLPGGGFCHSPKGRTGEVGARMNLIIDNPSYDD